MLEFFLFLWMVSYNQPSRPRIRSSPTTNTNTTYRLIKRAPDQRKHILELVGFIDVTSLDAIRMNMDTLKRLCYILEHMGGGGVECK